MSTRSDAISPMVEKGGGLAVIPEAAALRCQQAIAIQPARPEDPWLLRRLHVCVCEARDLPSPARRLREHLIHRGRNDHPGDRASVRP
jgi:DNA-binding transcriptional LysR family regulator